MEHTKDHPFDATVKIKSPQATIWAPERNNHHKTNGYPSGLIENTSLKDAPRPLGNLHACRASQRRYQQALACLHRANRDLGETAAFIAASLTTVTAIQAVISIANDKLELPKETLQVAFNSYIVIFVLIFVIGALRARIAILRRARAEREIDQTKKGIFDYCPVEEWPKIEE